MRPRGLLALSLPLAAAGCVAGHATGYALAGPTSQDALVHGYLGYVPQLLAACCALLALALVLRISGRLQGRLSVWPFAFLPLIAFCIQELLERLLAGLPAHSVLTLPVYAGLVAQLPIALLALLAARGLLRVADGAALTLVPHARIPFHFALAPVPAVSAWPHGRTAFDSLGRAPPR